MKKNCRGIFPYVPLLLMIFMTMAVLTTRCTKTELVDAPSEETDKIPPTIVSVDPENNVNTVSLTAKATVVFSEAMNEETLNSASFQVKKGNTDLAGTIDYSGKIATFTPSNPFEANTRYTCTINTSVKDAAGNALALSHTWSFTTVGLGDTKAPTVVSVLPSANATAVATSTNPSVTFSEPMNSASINSASFTIKKGSTALPGTISVSGNTATLDPAATLESNTLYTCTVTTAVKDAAGNALAAIKTWSFTTSAQADVTAPLVLSTSPAGNAGSVPVNSKPSVIFSEAMNAGTITSASFVLKRGTTTVTGTVSYSGTTATFTPSADLAAATLYTATITKSVKDAAGNAMVSDYAWSFTTATASVSPKSFAADVVPILNKCNTCHKHNWTPSSTPSVFHTNLVSSGHINLSNPTSGKIYSKVNGGHPSSGVTSAEKTTVLTWIKEGSKNN